MRQPTRLLKTFREIGNNQVLCQHVLADIVPKKAVEIGLLERAANDWNRNQHSIMVIFPTLVLFQDLIAHMPRYAGCTSRFRPIWIFPEGLTLHDIGSWDHRRVRTRVKLEGGDRNQRKLHVRGVRPGKCLRFGDLKREIQRGLHPRFPLRPRPKIHLISINDLISDLRAIFFR